MSLVVVGLAVLFILLVVLFFVVISTLVGFLLAILVALGAGLLADRIVGRHRGGILSSIAVGFLGALVGSIAAEPLDAPAFITLGGLPVVWTILGAIAVAAVWDALTKDPAAGELD